MRSGDPEADAADAAAQEVAKRQRRQELFDAIDSGETDLTYDARADAASGPRDQAPG
ncbi:hypothetical protein [Streptomyces sp. NPDC059850]|uniref:hypothetical protein n=1 Tax=Streptomyces sp. NPDC059850 TaxID=3346970 RepID=UPI00365C1245